MEGGDRPHEVAGVPFDHAASSVGLGLVALLGDLDLSSRERSSLPLGCWLDALVGLR